MANIDNIGLDLEKVLQRISPEIDDDEQWDDLIDEIIRGNVIPVIGPDFLIPNDRGIHKLLIDHFANQYGVTSNPQTFSELVYDERFSGKANKAKDKIYTRISSVIERIAEIPPLNSLELLLSTKVFPFIITTSFTPVAETAMKRVWGEENVRVLQFCNNAKKDMITGIGDVLNEDEMKIPTVYYMFGKYSREKHRYVVTDLDMMDFCKSWLSEISSPRNLSDIIKKRYLLILGNNYSDWQFRFIWYSMRSLKANQSQSSLVVSSHPKESPLIRFLERLDTITKNNPTEVVNEIVKRIAKRNTTELIHDIEKRIDVWKARTSYDVFLSYSRNENDSIFTRRLYDALKLKGLNVWYDHASIHSGEEWRQKIEEGIKSSRIFVPILSTHIENEYMKEHEYRIEWQKAAERFAKMGDVPFIVPLAENGFDIYNTKTKIPDVFKDIHALQYETGCDIEYITEDIIEKVNKVKELEKNYIK